MFAEREVKQLCGLTRLKLHVFTVMHCYLQCGCYFNHVWHSTVIDLTETLVLAFVKWTAHVLSPPRVRAAGSVTQVSLMEVFGGDDDDKCSYKSAVTGNRV